MKYVLNLLLILLIAIGCNPHREEIAVFEDTRSKQDVIDDFDKLEFKEGINDLMIEGLFSGVIWRFRVIVPVGTSETNKKSLVICLHGGASIIDTEIHKHTDCLAEPGLANINAILLCPNSDGFIWIDGPQQEKVLTLSELVQAKLPVDKNKVAIMGYSDGGNGAWFYAQHHPDKFSAAVALASSYNPVRPGNNSAKIDIPMYVIHGEDDQLFPLATTQDYVNTTMEAGTNIEFVIAPNLEHFDSCLYVPYLKNAALWLENTVWD